ncbi:hypothetical protein GDO86_012185 [Hymenochirus boettgeri]|uniref:Uncharacterized protein n=1 Tax=Hymenochirus boettgeri TaxID=247094 RepID=A0A8T2IRQ5_9PIPI|nr:hypothetical protein GDO86_012185 [Hymenochirus boettgeri]
MPQSQCHGPGSFSASNITFKKGFSCCNTDNCTPTTPALPDDNVQPNGLICPTCTLQGSDWCDTGEIMKCTGNETNCLLQITKMSGAVSVSEVLRGCASQSICNIGAQSVSANGININVDISCTGGANGVFSTFFQLPSVKNITCFPSCAAKQAGFKVCTCAVEVCTQ